MVEHPTITFKANLTNFANRWEEDRNNLRKIVIDQFIKEKAGHGNKEKTSVYKYFVEQLTSGDRVYLTRPVALNWGFDFIIHVENQIFKNGKENPTHSDILEDLKKKKQFNKNAYAKMVEALQEVFNCKDPDEIYSKYNTNLTLLNKGFSPELILKVVKWFFIEQDIRYWNFSGRNKFMEGIKEI